MSRPHGECCKARAWNLRWSQKQKHEERQQYSKAKNGNQSCQDRGESGEISGEDEQGHARRRGGRTSGRALFQKCGTWSWRRALLCLTCFPTITEQVDVKARIIGYGYGPQYVDMFGMMMPTKAGLNLGIAYAMELPDP
jgi:hypothetical protein